LKNGSQKQRRIIIPFFTELELHKSLLALLTKFAVQYRYPGESAAKDDAKSAIEAMKQLRLLIFRKLNLPV